MLYSWDILGIHCEWGQRILSSGDFFVQLSELYLTLKILDVHVRKQYNSYEAYSSQQARFLRQCYSDCRSDNWHQPTF